MFWLLRQFLNAANGLMMTCAGTACREAPRVHNSLHGFVRAKDHGADAHPFSSFVFIRPPACRRHYSCTNLWFASW
jgi:hypothetical protein